MSSTVAALLGPLCLDDYFCYLTGIQGPAYPSTHSGIYSHNHSPMSTSMSFDASSISIHLSTHMSLDIYTTTPPFIHPAPRPEFNPICTQASIFPSTHWVLSLDQLISHNFLFSYNHQAFLPSFHLSSFLLTYLLVYPAVYSH